MGMWLPFAKKVDLTKKGYGDGPFTDCFGVVLHVNVSRNGTPDSFWGPNTAVPTFEVFPGGETHQFLPLNHRPWCQMAGNANYGAIETAGMPSDPLTDAQLDACAKIVAAYHTELGIPLEVANRPGDRGLIIHQAGGQAWGGHSCPGDIRAAQRPEILRRAALLVSPKKEFTVSPDDAQKIQAMIDKSLDARVDKIATRVWSIPLGAAKQSPWHWLTAIVANTTKASK